MLSCILYSFTGYIDLILHSYVNYTVEVKCSHLNVWWILHVRRRTCDTNNALPSEYKYNCTVAENVNCVRYIPNDSAKLTPQPNLSVYIIYVSCVS